MLPMDRLQRWNILMCYTMKSIVVIISCLFFLSCDNSKTSFYEKDFYGNSIKIPVFLKHNKDKENLKYYCRENFYLKDSVGTTFFEARLCSYRSIDNSEYNFEFLKMIVEEISEQMKEEIPEIDILGVTSINKGNYFLYEITRDLNNKYSKIIFIAFESYFIYINYETYNENNKTIKYLDNLSKQFNGNKLIKNIVLPKNKSGCIYCHKILFYW